MDCYDLDFENQIPSPTDSASGSAAAMAEELVKQEIDKTYKIGSDFSTYYYKIVSTKPHMVGQLYVENSVLIWDGNPYPTRQAIQTFFEQLPSLTFNLSALDVATLHSAAVGGIKSYMIKTAGQYRSSGLGIVKPFNQQIIITADSDKWRIAADVFRSQEE